MKRGNLFSDFVDICALGGKRGWHERNGGSMSMLLDTPVILELEQGLNLQGEYQPIGVTIPELSREFFLITGDHCDFQDARECADELCGIIQISPDGSGYRTVMGFVSGQEPSRSLPTHLMAHAAYCQKEQDTHSVVYHCHPEQLIALSYLLPLDDESFSQALKRSGVSCTMTLPQGIGVVDHMEMEQDKLSKLTAEKFQRYDAVLWAFHGVICAGHNLQDVITKVEALEKAASIRMKLLLVPGGTRQEPKIL
jgi:rhamnulose-1-phosphate aldolase